MNPLHRSKRDPWLIAVLLPAILVSTFAAATVLSREPPTLWWLAALILASGGGLPLWLLLATHYRLHDGWLLVHSGPFRWRIAIAEIRSITPTRSAQSAPALSLDRLRIDYGQNRSLLISPREPARLIAEIEAARPV